MTNCVVCEKPVASCEKPKNLCFTCSMSCAGKLAYSVRYANKLRKQFNNTNKNAIRKLLFDKYVKPVLQSEKPLRKCFNILDLWGGGLFSDYILEQLDQETSVNNQKRYVQLYEIDQEKKLFFALKKYALEKNQSNRVKNHFLNVIPFCGNLADFVHDIHVNNQISFDFIWLDYCGAIKETDEEQDLEVLKQITNTHTIITITLSLTTKIRHWENIAFNQAMDNLDSIMNKYFPLMSRNPNSAHYKGMAVAVYRVPSKLRNLKYFQKDPHYLSVNNHETSGDFRKESNELSETDASNSSGSFTLTG